jgi:hypothetical protein
MPGLYQRGKLHSLSFDVKAAGLNHYGIQHVVALAPPQPDLDLMLMHDLGLLHYTHLPVPDGRHLRRIEEIEEVASRLTDHVLNDVGVLTMCNAGRNRSGMLSAMILRNLLGVTGAEAVAIVQRERPNALANEHFVHYLASQ